MFIMILSFRGCVYICIYIDVNKFVFIVIFKIFRVFDVCLFRFKVCYDCRGNMFRKGEIWLMFLYI